MDASRCRLVRVTIHNRRHLVHQIIQHRATLNRHLITALQSITVRQQPTTVGRPITVPPSGLESMGAEGVGVEVGRCSSVNVLSRQLAAISDDTEEPTMGWTRD